MICFKDAAIQEAKIRSPHTASQNPRVLIIRKKFIGTIENLEKKYSYKTELSRLNDKWNIFFNLKGFRIPKNFVPENPWLFPQIKFHALYGRWGIPQRSVSAGALMSMTENGICVLSLGKLGSRKKKCCPKFVAESCWLWSPDYPKESMTLPLTPPTILCSFLMELKL